MHGASGHPFNSAPGSGKIPQVFTSINTAKKGMLSPPTVRIITDEGEKKLDQELDEFYADSASLFGYFKEGEEEADDKWLLQTPPYSEGDTTSSNGSLLSTRSNSQEDLNLLPPENTAWVSTLHPSKASNRSISQEDLNLLPPENTAWVPALQPMGRPRRSTVAYPLAKPLESENRAWGSPNSLAHQENLFTRAVAHVHRLHQATSPRATPKPHLPLLRIHNPHLSHLFDDYSILSDKEGHEQRGEAQLLELENMSWGEPTPPQSPLSAIVPAINAITALAIPSHVGRSRRATISHSAAEVTVAN